MYLLSILVVVILTLFISVTSPMGGTMITYLIDFPSLLLLLLIVFPMLIASNLLKDFNNAFRIVLSKKMHPNLTQIKKALEAVSLVMKELLCGAFFSAFLTFIIILHELSNPASLGPALAVATLSVIYALAFILVLLPLQSKLKVMIVEFIKDSDEAVAV